MLQLLGTEPFVAPELLVTLRSRSVADRILRCPNIMGWSLQGHTSSYVALL